MFSGRLIRIAVLFYKARLGKAPAPDFEVVFRSMSIGKSFLSQYPSWGDYEQASAS